MAKQITLRLTEPQRQFVLSDAPHPGLVAGYGAGKSQAAVARIALRACQYPKLSFGFVEPTYDLVRLIAFPRFSELLSEWGVDHDLNKADAIMKLENDSQIIFRSADNAHRLVGFEIADGVVDEIDTLRTDQAADVWTKMLGRCRQNKPDGAPNTLGAVSTPEGFKWFYERFHKNPGPGYELIRAPTSSNPYLPDGYLDQLRATYSSSQLQAYCDGIFVNLTAGSVYAEFNRTLNACTTTIQTSEPLHIGMDFNVGKMSAVTFVLRDGDPHAVDELTGILDTPAMIAAIKARYEGHAIFVYPDASGQSRKSNNASESDIALLRAARFTVLTAASNPAVKDRVLAVNQMICAEVEVQGSTLGLEMRGDKPVKRRLRVNVDRCPAFVEGLEKQAYDKNGEPDKTAGFDHVNDAAGYFVFYKFPVRGRGVQRISLGGI